MARIPPPNNAIQPASKAAADFNRWAHHSKVKAIKSQAKFRSPSSTPNVVRRLRRPRHGVLLYPDAVTG
jgi:hypothetical protein